MPVWRPRPEWLREAVAGALAQEGCDFELIVVDDGSEPPVAELIEDLEHERLRLLRLPRGGVSRARNAGVAAARGDFFRFVDCDDLILPRSTAHLLELAHGRQDVIAYGATLVCDERLSPLSTASSTLRGSAAEACLLNRFTVTIHSLLLPREVVEATGDWDPALPVSQDWDYVLRALDHASVIGDGRIATHYRTHADMNSRNLAAGVEGYRRIVAGYFERHPEQRGTRLERQAKAGYHLFALEETLARDPRALREAIRHLRPALRLDAAGALAATARGGRRLLRAAARRASFSSRAHAHVG